MTSLTRQTGFLLLVAMPFVTCSFLLLVVRPGATRSFLLLFPTSLLFETHGNETRRHVGHVREDPHDGTA